MSQASELLRRGANAHARQFPATISIGGQSYADGVSTSGLQSERDLVSGGILGQAKLSFWLPVSKFTDAGQPLPTTGKALTWLGVAYIIADVARDASGATLIIRCNLPDE